MISKTLFERYFERVPFSGCWLWTHTYNENKKMCYGTISIDGCKFRAHRLSYELFIKPIPKGL